MFGTIAAKHSGYLVGLWSKAADYYTPHSRRLASLGLVLVHSVFQPLANFRSMLATVAATSPLWLSIVEPTGVAISIALFTAFAGINASAFATHYWFRNSANNNMKFATIAGYGSGVTTKMIPA